MKIRFLTFWLCALLAGCTSNDFHALDLLRVGMPQAAARASIERFGFNSRENESERPAVGWPQTGNGFFDVAWRAGEAEEKIKQTISYAEAYPVTHGLLGYGWIYLFYDTDKNLIHYYRLQIN